MQGTEGEQNKFPEKLRQMVENINDVNCSTDEKGETNGKVRL